MASACKVCGVDVLSGQKFLTCSVCSQSAHLSCLNDLSQAEFEVYHSSGLWRCSSCQTSTRPKGDNTPVKTVHSSYGSTTGDSDSSEKSSTLKGTRPKILCAKPTCRQGFRHNAYRLRCKSCKLYFHMECAKVSKDMYSNVVDRWCCDECQHLQSTQGSSQPSQGDISLLLCEIRKEMKCQTEEILSALNAKVDEIEAKLDHIGRMYEESQKEIAVLKEENNVLSKRVEDLEGAWRNASQKSLKNDVEVFGIPYVSGENVSDLVVRVAEVAGVPILPKDISECFRAKAKPQEGEKSVIVASFVRRADKDSFLQSARRKKITNSSIKLECSKEDRIYVNQRLTFENRKLLRDVREISKAKVYKYLWVKEGRIYLRKDDTSKAVLISSQKDLESL